MKYTCLNCGSSAHRPDELCNPTSDKLDATFCATSTDQVCDQRLSAMRYSCDRCGGMSPDAEHLCHPKKITRTHEQTARSSRSH